MWPHTGLDLDQVIIFPIETLRFTVVAHRSAGSAAAERCSGGGRPGPGGSRTPSILAAKQYDSPIRTLVHY